MEIDGSIALDERWNTNEVEVLHLAIVRMCIHERVLPTRFFFRKTSPSRMYSHLTLSYKKKRKTLLGLIPALEFSF